MRIRAEDAASIVRLRFFLEPARGVALVTSVPSEPPGQGQNKSEVQHEVVGAILAQCYGGLGVDKLLSAPKRYNSDLDAVQVYRLVQGNPRYQTHCEQIT